MSKIQETIGRRALIATSSNYRSVAEAIMEFVDNPFDYRRGRHLNVNVEVDKEADWLRVTDYGGEGMDDSALRDWNQWGEGHEHNKQDIGQYHVGGKSAAIYLAEDLEFICRLAGTDTIWHFRDRQWGSRTTPLSSDVTQVLNLPESLKRAKLESGVGFVQITLRGLKSNRYEIGLLERRLADAYRTLIRRGECVIRVNGKPLGNVELPWSSSIGRIEFGPVRLDQGLRISGVVGALDRDRLPNVRGARYPHGIRTEYNGRRITDGEEFGHNLSGRGALMRLYGEVVISGGELRPNQLKNGWPYDSDEWQIISAAMHEQMSGTVAKLNEIADAKPVSRIERKGANSARRRAEHALRRLEQLEKLAHRGSIPAVSAPAGRRSPTSENGIRESTDQSSNERQKPTPRTPPPLDPVGRLLRRVGGMPPVRLDALGDQTPRTEWRVEGDQQAIVVNTDYPLYSSLGPIEEYVFESILFHMLDHNTDVTLAESRILFDQLVWLDRSADEEG